MNNEKQKKIILISIIAAGIVLLAAIIAVTISLLGDKNKDSQKETTKHIENITTVETKEEATTEKSSTKETTTEELTTEKPTTEEPSTEPPTTEEPTTQAPTEPPTQAPTEQPSQAPTLPPIVEELMEFSVVDGVLYQSNSKKSEIVDEGISYYELSPKNNAIYYRDGDTGNEYIRTVGQEKVDIDLGSEYGGSLLSVYDTGEAYFLGETIYTNEDYWCRTPIYYFDGKELKLVTDRAPAGQMSSTPTTKTATNVPIILFEQFTNLDTCEVDYFVMAYKDKVQEVEFGDNIRLWTGSITIQEEGKKIWYTKVENNSTNLYEVANKAGKFENPKLIDSNLYSVCVDYINGFGITISTFGEDVMYFKNGKSIYNPAMDNSNSNYNVVDSVDLYIGGKLVDTNVYAQSTIIKNDILFYKTDFDLEKWASVLNTYSNGIVKTLAYGVKSYYFPSDGVIEITYLNGETSTMTY